ncbi:hypothetical protein [Thiolapillus sp.]
MKLTNIVAATAVAAAISIPAIAGTSMSMNHDNKQMMKGAMTHHGGMGAMTPEMMKQKQEMMKKHMANMEKRLANVEALLQELIALQKKKSL